ncbi:MAG: hypothetical protein IKJ59_15695 [Clostridia bacterium]|nr:hypothetical protein [Clostridia bacterium]
MTVVAYLLEHRLPKPRGAGINDTSCRYLQKNNVKSLLFLSKFADIGKKCYICGVFV